LYKAKKEIIEAGSREDVKKRIGQAGIEKIRMRGRDRKEWTMKRKGDTEMSEELKRKK
jgi:hypothetical protein